MQNQWLLGKKGINDLMPKEKGMQGVYRSSFPSNGMPSVSSAVHREDEWELIAAEIFRRQNGPALPNSITTLYGTAGIGKTTFIQRTLIPRINEHFPDLPLALIDFDRDWRHVDQRYDKPQGRGNVILDLLAGLQHGASGKIVPGLEDAKQTWEAALAEAQAQQEMFSDAQPDKLAETEDNLVRLFCEYISLLTLDQDRRPVVLVMDTVEEIDRDLLGWIQEELQTPTTDTGYVLWVAAGRQPIDCQPFFLRSRYSWHALQPFGEKLIEKQIPERIDLAPIFKHFSYGLPAATSKLATAIVKIEQKENRVLGPRELEEDFTGELILSLADLLDLKRYLGELRSDLREGLQVLSPLRLFNVTVVAQLLPEMLPKQFKRATIGAEALYVIQQMVRTNLVSWDRERRGYVIEEPIRRIISLIFEHNQPQYYVEIHRWAEEKYREWAENVEAKRLDYIIEALYHKTIMLSINGETAEALPKLVKMLEELVQDYYVNEGERDEEAIDELRQQLVSDQDFVELLPPKGMEYLVRTLQR